MWLIGIYAILFGIALIVVAIRVERRREQPHAGQDRKDYPENHREDPDEEQGPLVRRTVFLLWLLSHTKTRNRGG